MQNETRIGWRGEVLPMQRFEGLLRKISFFGLLTAMLGLVTSPAILSAGIVSMMLAGLALPNFKEQIRRFWNHKPAVLMASLFLLQVISGIWTREIGYKQWLGEVNIKSPLFLTMYGLAVLGPFSMRQVRLALLVLLVAVCFVGTGTSVDIFLHAAEIEARIKVSKEVQVWLGCSHIYFSIIAAFAILANVWSLSKPSKILFQGEKWLIGLLVFICFLEMHLMTTRTGLVGLYLTTLMVGLVILVQRRRFVWALALVLFLGSVPVVGYYNVPSFQFRIENTVMDLTEYFGGKDPNYLSIGTRLESWKTAINLWKKHPMIGVAMADLHADMTDQYVIDETALCPENFQQPHNQFIQNLAGLGLVGFLMSLAAWFYPALSKNWPKGVLFWLFWINYMLAMMGESTMERQVGVAFLVTGFMMSLGLGNEQTNAESEVLF